ncbi:MAG: response regulator [Phormidesmis sp.]
MTAPGDIQFKQQQSATEEDWNVLSLMSLFRVEIETQVAELNQHLLALEQSTTHSTSREHREHLEALMRAAHSIKGAARIVQVEAAVKISHALEDCFIAAQRNILTITEERIDVLLMGADLLSKLGNLDEQSLSAQTTPYDADVDDVVVALEAVVGIAEKADRNKVRHRKAQQLLDAEQNIQHQATSPTEQNAEQQKAQNTDTEKTDTENTDTEKPSAEKPHTEKPHTENPHTEKPHTEKPHAKQQPVTPSPADSDTPDSRTLESHAVNNPIEAIKAPIPNVDESNRMIRISTDNLSRLMGLAGEILVESNWLQPFSDSLLATKRKQQAALSRLKQYQDSGSSQESSFSQDKTLSEATAALQACHALLGEHLEEVEQISRRFGQLSDRLYREVIASHMCAFEEGTRGYARLVRDTAKQQGKQVVLEIKGLNTQIDRDILTKLDTPITHLLINAITHGIESPEVRLAKGKPAEAKITLSAMHRSGMLMLEVEDDGAGINFARLREKIIQKELITAAIAQKLSESELIEFLFLPGFSTAPQLTEMAGRGYGLDLARTMAQSVGGSLQVTSPTTRSALATATSLQVPPPQAPLPETHPSGGTCFRFHLPLTLSVVRSLLFEIENEAYAVSLSRINRVVKLNKEQIHYSENRPYFRLEKENISLVVAHQVLGLTGHAASTLTPSTLTPSTLKPNTLTPEKKLPVIVMGEGKQKYGLCVDRLLEEKDLVVRPLDPRLGKVPNISAAALSETGAPVLILDVADVLRAAEKMATGIAPPPSINPDNDITPEPSADETTGAHNTAPNEPTAPPKKILVVDDSMTVRAMEKKLLQNRGYTVDIAVDGAEGWNAVRIDKYDLVITDVDMPRMNGIELICKIRDYEATKKLPIIVVSYKDREVDQLAGLNAGANYYLTKSSFHNDGLITAVMDLIGA